VGDRSPLQTTVVWESVKNRRVRPPHSTCSTCLLSCAPATFVRRYGNDDDRVDSIAEWVAQTFSKKLSAQHTYRNSIPTLSVLTITSNVVSGSRATPAEMRLEPTENNVYKCCTVAVPSSCPLPCAPGDPSHLWDLDPLH
jgi:hypothetical protein